MVRFEMLLKKTSKTELWVNTTGFMFLKSAHSKKILKTWFPDEKGFIWIKGHRKNFKEMLFKIMYPKVSLKNKYIYKIGKTHNIKNLFALSKNEYLNCLRLDYKISKNNNTGETIITKSHEDKKQVI